jgi:hypothetical protein
VFDPFSFNNGGFAMSKRTAICAGCAAIILVVGAIRADAAQPSAIKLSQMGLSGATIVSDQTALGVRGYGYRGSSTRVWSSAKIVVNGTKYVDKDYSSGEPVHTIVVAPVGGGKYIFAGGGAGVWTSGQR